MNETGARVFRHMVAVEQGNDKPVAVIMQGMRAGHLFELKGLRLRTTKLEFLRLSRRSKILCGQ